eukprot:s3363_g9.t2
MLTRKLEVSVAYKDSRTAEACQSPAALSAKGLKDLQRPRSQPQRSSPAGSPPRSGAFDQTNARLILEFWSWKGAQKASHQDASFQAASRALQASAELAASSHFGRRLDQAASIQAQQKQGKARDLKSWRQQKVAPCWSLQGIPTRARFRKTAKSRRAEPPENRSAARRAHAGTLAKSLLWGEDCNEFIGL